MHIGDILAQEGLMPTKPINRSRGGIMGPKSEIRGLIALMVDRPILQIAKLTKNWSHQQMYMLYQECQAFTKNPPALFWLKYKKLKIIYGKSKTKEKAVNKKGLSELGKGRRGEEQAERQGVLF